MTNSALRARRDTWAFIAVLGIALILRCYRLGAMDLWLDELLSLETSDATGFVSHSFPKDVVLNHVAKMDTLATAAPWWRIWRSIRQEEQMPPLYFAVLRAWRFCFHDSEVALRSLSVIASFAAVAMLYLAAKEYLGARAAAWAALLMALSPIQIIYAQEARPYALATAALTAALAALAMIDVRGVTKPRLIALSVALAAAVLSHYFAVAPALAMGIYSLLAFRGRKRFAVLGAMVSGAAIFALIGGAVFLAQRSQFQSKTRDFTPDPAPARQLLWTPVGQMVDVIFVPPFANAIAAASLAASFCFAWRSRATILAALWIVIGFGVLAVIDLLTGSNLLNVPRYGMMAAPGVFLLIAGALAGRGRILPHLLPAAAAIAIIACTPTAYFNRKGQWRGTAIAIQHQSHGSDPIVIVAGPQRDWWLGGVLLELRHYYSGPFPDVVLTNPPLSDAMTSALRRSPRIWLIMDKDLPSNRTTSVSPEFVDQKEHPKIGIGVVMQARWRAPSTQPSTPAQENPAIREFPIKNFSQSPSHH